MSTHLKTLIAALAALAFCFAIVGCDEAYYDEGGGYEYGDDDGERGERSGGGGYDDDGERGERSGGGGYDDDGERGVGGPLFE